MPRTRIKICGVRTADIALAAVEAGADAVGLVFAHGSPRLVTLAEARRVVNVLPPLVEPIGLFVDAPVEQVRQTAHELDLRTVQLHGHETPQYAASLAPLRVIKALHFDEHARQHLAHWQVHYQHVAAILWDTPPSPAAGTLTLAGGSGKSLDWDALAKLKAAGVMTTPPTILAGGLTPRNVAQAIATVHPFAVDVSSGVESTRGVKDAALIEAFCAAVRTAD